ncbi:MAG: thermonuclease family protein [Rickettsiales bacterium]|nr:thermonuclease family protein [Rickettsiales bacterium]
MLMYPLQLLALTQGPGYSVQDPSGHSYQIADIVPPFDDPQQMNAAMAWLGHTLKNNHWKAHPLTPRADRYGRLMARVRSMAQDDLAESMLRAGHAMVAFDIPDPKRAAKLLAIETDARQSQRGIWASRTTLPFDKAEAKTGRYVQVEGRVVRVDHHKGHIFLAFGEDWRTDPTGFIPAGAAPRFSQNDLMQYAGKNVRLRGWLEEQNGPSILLVQPYAIEMLP